MRFWALFQPFCSAVNYSIVSHKPQQFSVVSAKSEPKQFSMVSAKTVQRGISQKWAKTVQRGISQKWAKLLDQYDLMFLFINKVQRICYSPFKIFCPFFLYYFFCFPFPCFNSFFLFFKSFIVFLIPYLKFLFSLVFFFIFQKKALNATAIQLNIVPKVPRKCCKNKTIKEHDIYLITRCKT